MENTLETVQEDCTDAEITVKKEDIDAVLVSNPDDECLKQQQVYNGGLTDEYHYLKNGEYTSEIFKVVVQNVPHHFPYPRLRSAFVGILGFMPKKMKYNALNDYAFLCFQNEEERQKAIELLNGQKFQQLKGKVLLCKKAPPAKDPFVKKRKAEEQNKDEVKKAKQEEDLKKTPEERILDVVCPNANVPYDEQVMVKEKLIKLCIDKLTLDLKRNIKREDRTWLKEESLSCLDLLPIVKSPVVENYRNKVEFTIGVGPDGKDNTVGFRLGSYKEGSMLIVEPSKCINCSKEAMAIGKQFQTFIQALTYPSYNIGNHVGFWQQLIVRSCLTGDIMLIVQVFPSFLEKDEFELLKKKLVEFISSTDHVTSLYVSSSSMRNNNIDTFEHLYGNKYVKETLLDLQFQISPDSFFQVNTRGAEILYQIVKDWCNTTDDDSCVLDVCCGTGTIGLCIAHNSNMAVVGVEICKQAVEDAKENATLNGVENATFICGPAQKVLRDEIRKIKKRNIIAVVDPPRAGLHRSVLSSLRSCSAIQKIIYVSCSPKQAFDNFVSLCRPKSKKFSGTPFKTTRAVPIDLFPHTPHYELIVEFERVKASEQPAVAIDEKQTSSSDNPDSSTVSSDNASVTKSTNPSTINESLSSENLDSSTVSFDNATKNTNPPEVT